VKSATKKRAAEKRAEKRAATRLTVKRQRPSGQAPAELCGCNPDVVTQVIVLVGQDKAAIERATTCLDADPRVAVVAVAQVEEGFSAIYKECTRGIAYLPESLRALADALSRAPKDDSTETATQNDDKTTTTERGRQ
jgi:hypothetical protein